MNEAIYTRMQRDKINFDMQVIEFNKIEFSRVDGIPMVDFQSRRPHEKTSHQQFPLSSDAYAGLVAIASRNLKPDLLDEMDDAMASAVVNYFMAGLEGQMKLVLGTGRDDAKNIVSIVPVDTVVIPDLDIYDMVSNIAEIEGLDLHEFIETANGHIMRFTTERRADVRPTVGDVVVSGFEIFNSPFGHDYPSVSSYILRWTCTNGMTRTETNKKAIAIASDTEIVLNQIKDGVLVSLNRFNADVSQMRELVDQAVEHPEDMLESIGAEFSIPNRNIEAAIEALDEEPDIRNNMWGIVNAITRVGNNQDIPFESRHRMQNIGLQIVSTNLERCSQCGTLHKSDTRHTHSEDDGSDG